MRELPAPPPPPPPPPSLRPLLLFHRPELREYGSALKAELESARAKAQEEAARVKSVEEEMEAMRQQLALMQTLMHTPPPQPASSGGEAGGDAAAGTAPSREEFVKMLESSALAEKLTEVESLLRALLSQNAAQ